MSRRLKISAHKVCEERMTRILKDQLALPNIQSRRIMIQGGIVAIHSFRIGFI